MGLKLSTTDMDQSTLMDSCTVGFGISMVHYEMSSMEVQQLLLLPYSKDVCVLFPTVQSHFWV